MNKNNKENQERIQISEMFMAQADHERCFYGIIKRGIDEFGNPFVFSRIAMPDGLIQACAGDQKVLGKMLDQMCIMVLDMGLHDDAGQVNKIFQYDFFLN